MNVILCHASDTDALWLYHRLVQRDNQVELINADTLPLALTWRHHLSDHDTRFSVKRAGHPLLRQAQIRCLINRLEWLDLAHWQKLAADDYPYVAQEMHAFFVSWLYGLSQQANCLNPPSGNGLAGTYFRSAEWLCRAHEAGLPTRAYQHNSTKTIAPAEDDNLHYVLVVGQHTVGATLPTALTEGCVKLAQRTNNPLLEIGFRRVQNQYFFQTATPRPAFPQFGEAGVKAIRATLT